MKKRTKITALGAAAISAAVSGIGPAEAAIPQHKYSVGYEMSNGWYNGISDTRPNPSMSNVDPSGCLSYFSGYPIYTTEWVLVTSDAQNWFELGTGHQCSNFGQYNYWGYGYSGSWIPLGENTADANSHTYTILYASSQWNFKIDGSVLGTASGYFPDHGIQLEEGLESYDGAVTVGNYSNTSLKYNSGGGFNACVLVEGTKFL